MAVITTSDVNEVFRHTYYKNKKLQKVLHGKKHRALLNGMTKRGKTPRSYLVPVLSDWGGTASASFTAAQGGAAAPVIAEFDPGGTQSALHRATQIDTETILRAQGDPEGFMTEVELKTDLTLEALADTREMQLWGDGSNQIGSIASSATATITLNRASDVKYFRKGMKCVFAATTTGALRNSGATLTVASKSALDGSVTMTANIATLDEVADDDYIFAEGNAANGSTVVGPLGLAAWKAGTSSDFLGVNVAADAGVLSMLTYAGDDADILNCILGADAYGLETNGGVRDKCFLNPQDFAKLVDQLHSQTRFKEGSSVMAGYSYVTVNGVSGQTIEVGITPHLVQNEFYLLDWTSWELTHLGSNVVDIDATDGSAARKLASSSGIEIRGLSYCQPVTSRPGANVYVTMT